MKGLLYTLTLEEPVLANTLGGEPNSARSLFYIPGGLVRGAAINAYQGSKDAADLDFRRLFLNGSTRFMNAYPLVGGLRSLPVPLTWQVKRKPEPGDPPILYDGMPDDVDTKKPGYELWAGDYPVTFLDETWQMNIHTQRDAERGRAVSDAGAVYRYIALPAGMRLQGIILADFEPDLQAIQNLLSGRILLGKARTAGYGKACIEFAPLPSGWREAAGPALSPTPDLTITLLSPTLVRDANGQPSEDIQTALEARLGQKAKIIEKCCRTEIAGGFNRKWGMPLPQTFVITAGSVFTIHTEDVVPVDTLLRLEETGIGERRAEGFGRVTVDFPFPAKPTWQRQTVNLYPLVDGNLKAPDPTARLMLNRRLHHDLDALVLTAAQTASEAYVKDRVPNSQLSRWRVILRDALSKMSSEDPIQRMKTFKEDSKGKPGWEKMARARVKIASAEAVTTPRLTDWIETLLDNPDSLAQALGPTMITEYRLGAESVNVADFNTEYRLRLLDAVLAVLAKKNSEGLTKESSEGGKNG